MYLCVHEPDKLLQEYGLLFLATMHTRWWLTWAMAPLWLGPLGPLPTWLNSKSMIMVRILKKPGEMQWRYKPQEYVYIIYIYGHIWIYMFMYVHVNINKIHILGTGQKLPQHLPNRWSPRTPSEHWMVYFMEIPSNKKKHKWMRTRKPPYILYIYIITGWWFEPTLWKMMEFVNWDDDIPNI
jgi:hypothetical protein